MRVNIFSRRADTAADDAMVERVTELKNQSERLTAETKRLAEWAVTHDGIHAELFRHVLKSMGDDSAKATLEFAKFIYATARAKLIEQIFKLVITAIFTAILAKLGIESLHMGGFSLGELIK